MPFPPRITSDSDSGNQEIAMDSISGSSMFSSSPANAARKTSISDGTEVRIVTLDEGERLIPNKDERQKASKYNVRI